MTSAFNVGFECPAHNAGALEFKYLLGSPLGDFWSVLSKSSSASFLFLLCCSSTLVPSVRLVTLCYAIILKVNVDFNC